MFKVVLVIASLAMLLYAQESFIQNGNFTDSSGAHWTLEANGAKALGKVELGRYVVNIESGNGRENAPQLLQRGIELKASESYLLTFKVSASDSGAMRVLVAGDGSLVYNDSAASIVSIGTNGKICTIPFFVAKANGNARLLFNCGLTPGLARISIDSVTLMRNTAPTIRLVQPTLASRWISGSERQIEWMNSGNLDKVKISFTSDKGVTWIPVTSLASNQKSFWWKIPATISGNECMLVVSDSSGMVADTSEMFRIVAAGSVDVKEMVKNGDFLDTTDWRIQFNSPARGKGMIFNDEYMISIDTAGDQAWQVKLEQPGFTLDNGTMYRFSFDAYASHDRGIYANVGADNGNPAWSVYGGDSIPVKITTKKMRYYQTIIMKYPTSSNVRVEFNCGKDTGKVFIDNVSLVKLENANVFVFSPSLGSLLKSGARFNIEWHAEKVTTIDLDFSSDSGKTWSPIFEGIDNLGVVSWTVPDASSENCFIRITQAGSDTVIGESSQFVINAFGTPVKTGELIANGSFSNNLQGWNTTFTNAQGQALTSDQSFKMNVSQPGEKLETIVLAQGAIPVLKGKEYTFAFDAFANGTRMLGVAVVTETDAAVLMDTIVDLPAVEKRTLFKFTAEKDAMIRIEFRMGGSHAGVFLDDVSFYTGELLEVTTPKTVLKSRAPAAFSVHCSGSRIEFVNCGNVGSLSLYTIRGECALTLPVVQKTTVWNGRLSGGSRAAAGRYIAVLDAPGVRMTSSFVLR